MIYLTQLETILITCIPSLASILSIFVAVKTIFKSLAKLKDNEEIKAERDELKAQNGRLLAECRKMRKQTALLVEKVTHIAYKDLSEVQSDKELQV
jgi:hypothetical protein